MRIRTITYLKAYSLFEQKKYEDAMQLFSSVSATPKTVVGLFPSAIAGEWSQSVEPEVVDSEAKTTDQPENGTPGTPSIASAIPEVLRKDTGSDTSSILSQRTEQSNAGSLDSKDLTRAILSLIQYLADMRFKLSRWLNTNTAPQDDNETEVRMLFYLSPDTQDPAVECTPDLEFEDAAIIVDTTLFRAYMLRRPQLVGPLVRRPNRCIPSVVQEMLERAHVLPSLKDANYRNIEIWQNFFWARDCIVKHCNYYKIWGRKRMATMMRFQLPLQYMIICKVPIILFCTCKS